MVVEVVVVVVVDVDELVVVIVVVIVMVLVINSGEKWELEGRACRLLGVEERPGDDTTENHLSWR